MQSTVERRRVRVALVAMAALVLSLVGALGAPGPIASAAYTTAAATFTGQGCSSNNTVSGWGQATAPANAVSLTITIVGAGGSAGDNRGGNGGRGGNGAIVTSTVPVTPGQVVWARIGCGGTDGGTNAAGWALGKSRSNVSGGGGGASAVCVGTSTAGCSGGTVWVVAGGGGGGGRGSGNSGCTDQTGGAGGSAGGSNSVSTAGGTGYSGAGGSNGSGDSSSTGGGGGTNEGDGGSAGSGLGTGTQNGFAGAKPPTPSGATGDGGLGSAGNNGIEGGSGGGGFGGGAGGGGGRNDCAIWGGDRHSGAGGGAGSSWVRSGATNVSVTTAGHNGSCTVNAINSNAGGSASSGNQSYGCGGGLSGTTWTLGTSPTGGNQTTGNATKGTPLSISLTNNDGESARTCQIVTAPTKGTYTLSGTSPSTNCSVSYTASTGQAAGTDSFTYRVVDTDGATSTDHTVTIPIVNRFPTLGNQSISTPKGSGTAITLSTTPDADGETVTCTIGTAPTKGTLSGSGCARTYTPNPNTSGSDSFTYTATDGVGGSATPTVDITIPNATPTSSNATVNVAPGSSTPISLGGSDSDDAATTCAATAPSAGSLSALDTCTPTYTAPATLGTYSFTYTRSDGNATSPSATVTVVVQSPDVAITKSHVGVFNDGTQGTYTIGVSNVGNGATSGTITVVDDLPLGMTYASANVTGSGFGCVPQLGGTRVSCTRTTALAATAGVTFTITVNLEDGTPSSANTATVSASPDHSSSNNTATDPTTVNLRPEAVSIEVETGVDEPVAVTLDASDPEGGALTYNVGVPTSGALSGVAPNLMFTPASGSDVDVSFTYTVSDPNGHVSYAATVSVRVTRPGMRGRVTSDGTGFGVGGVTVRLYEDGVGFTDVSAVTDGSGHYDLGDEVPAGTYRVIFKDPAQDYVDEWFGDSLLRSTSTPVEVVEGGEVIADAGLAVGAQVNVTVSNTPGPFTVALYNTGPVGASAYRSISGVTGSVSLRGLPAGTYFVSVADPSGVLSTRWSGNVADRGDAVGIAVTAGGTANRALTLQSPVSVAGNVVDAGGAVEGVTVQAYGSESLAFVKSAKTNAAGDYAIKGLAAGGYKLVFRDSSGAHPVTWYEGTSVSTAATVAVVGGDPQTADTELPVAAAVTGTVTGGPEGTTPLAGAKVTLYLASSAVRTYVADANGVYTATGLAAGQYTVLFNATGHRIEYNLDAFKKADADPVTVDAGQTTTIDATLTPT